MGKSKEKKKYERETGRVDEHVVTPEDHLFDEIRRRLNMALAYRQYEVVTNERVLTAIVGVWYSQMLWQRLLNEFWPWLTPRDEGEMAILHHHLIECAEKRS